MKKLLVLLLVVVLPAFAFADFQIGAVGMYKGTMAQLKAKDVGLEDFTFGAEARLKLSLFQAGVSALYYPEVPLAKPPAIVASASVSARTSSLPSMTPAPRSRSQSVSI